MYTIKEMTAEQAEVIMNWEYEAPYSFYNMTEDEETFSELTDGTYFSIVDESQHLIGFICFGENAQVPGGRKAGLYSDETYIDIGVGLNPIHTGKGMGERFLQYGLHFGKERYPEKGFRLSVAIFNKRAISVYKKVGFVSRERFLNGPNDSQVEFLLMTTD